MLIKDKIQTQAATDGSPTKVARWLFTNSGWRLEAIEAQLFQRGCRVALWTATTKWSPSIELHYKNPSLASSTDS